MSSEVGVERPTSLSLREPQPERRVHFGGDVTRLITEERNRTATTCSRDPAIRPKRVRSASFSSGDSRYGNQKRRKRYRVAPSKFLLGGNITDPLNLGSLDKEEIPEDAVEGAAGGIKKSDAVRVIIPPNINDPLNLDVSSENEDSLTDALQRQIRKRRRNRKRKRRLSEPTVDTQGSEIVNIEDTEQLFLNNEATPVSIKDETSPQKSIELLKPLTVDTSELPTSSGLPDEQPKDSGSQITPTSSKAPSSFQRPFKKQRSKSDNKIVSPVVPQPGVERKRHPTNPRNLADKPHLSQQNLKLPAKFNPKNEHFQYGNYNKYYGYRNPNLGPDLRLTCFKNEWFKGKEVLDVGCNIGHISLTIARDFKPKRVVGIDIDKKLVNIAQKNIKHYVRKGDMEEANNFPKSMRLLYGPLKPPVAADGMRHFPHNIKFVHGNYVLESDELLETVRPEFDVILCLSITKWIHLNWGDPGLKRFFRRVFYNLKPGGRLILEPQGWPSYNKRRKLTMRIFENYKSIRLFPDKFNDYLLHDVGFSTSERMVIPHHSSRGFQRPIIVYTKAEYSSRPGSVREGNSPRYANLNFEKRNVGNIRQKNLKNLQAQNAKESLLRVTNKGDTTCAHPPLFKSENVDLEHKQGENSSNKTLRDVKVEKPDEVMKSIKSKNIDEDKSSVHPPLIKSEKDGLEYKQGENSSNKTLQDVKVEKSDEVMKSIKSDNIEDKSSVRPPLIKSENVDLECMQEENSSNKTLLDVKVEKSGEVIKSLENDNIDANVKKEIIAGNEENTNANCSNQDIKSNNVDKNESSDNVCDNNTRLSSGNDTINSGSSSLTHSLVVKPNVCIVKSSPSSKSSQTLNSKISKLCTNVETSKQPSSNIDSNREVQKDMDTDGAESTDGCSETRT